LHTIQLELNRAIYMDERRREARAEIRAVTEDFVTLAESLAATFPLGDSGHSRRPRSRKNAQIAPEKGPLE